MTVCIAAIRNEGHSLIVCADRMFTNPGLSVEFETTERKIEQISDRCVAMAAGHSVNATEILEGVRKSLRQFSSPSAPNLPDLAELFRQEYSRVRNKFAAEAILTPWLGADYDRFRSVMPLPVYLEKQPQIFQQLGMMCSQQNLGTDLLIAGIDETGGHLFHISHPGLCAQLDKLGYAATGSGGIHATIRLSLSGQNRARPLLETLVDVYISKRSAEVAPGVGEATDIAIIDTKVKFCSLKVMEELRRIHEAKSTLPALDLGQLHARISDESLVA